MDTMTNEDGLVLFQVDIQTQQAYIQRDSLFGTQDAPLLREFLTSMASHLSDPGYQADVLRKFSEQVDEKPDLCNLIGEESSQLEPLHTAVLAALNIYSHYEYVFKASCSAIYSMASHSKTLQQYLVARGAYIAIVDRMRDSLNDGDIQTWGCRALRALSFDNALHKEMLFKYNLISHLKAVLDELKDNLGAQEECIALLACVSADLDVVRESRMLNNMPARILDFMYMASLNPDSLEVALEALAVFLQPEDEDVLLKGKIVIGVQSALERHASCTSLQAKGCIIMQLMVADDQCLITPYIAADIIKTVADAMNRCPFSEEVLTEGCVAISVITRSTTERTHIHKRLVDLKAFDSIISIIENFPKNATPVQISKECLAALTNESHALDRVLRRACEKASLKVVAYLLDLGASISYGSPSDSPLCIAAQKGNLRLAEYLLQREASDVQAALAVCLCAGHNDLAGLLLRHIGLEREAGCLVWSGLQIKELYPEMLYPSLMRQHAPETLKSTNSAPLRTINLGASDSDYTALTSLRRPKSLTTTYATDMIVDASKGSCSPSISRPRSLSGARSPFNYLDPRFQATDLKTRLILPPSPISDEDRQYPGHPSSTLIADPDSGLLLRCNYLTPPPSPIIEVGRNWAMRSSITENFDTSSRGDRAAPHRCISVSHERPKPFEMIDAEISLTPKVKKQSMVRNVSSATMMAWLRSPETKLIKLFDASHNSICSLSKLISDKSIHVVDFFANLEKLDLSYNSISEVPAKLCELLPKLRSISFRKNLISVFPYELLWHKNVQNIDLSGNLIRDLCASRMKITLSLERLNLSDNQLQAFPPWLQEIFPRLVFLDLSGNQLKEIPAVSVGLRQLKELDLSSNLIGKICPEFFEKCVSLEKVDLSRNELVSLPEYCPSTLSTLININLADNMLQERKPFFVPRFILQLPNLQVLDISRNRVMQFPEPALWASRSVTTLNFSGNRISKMNLGKSSIAWSGLTSLDLSHNRLSEIPPEVGHLTSLSSLNVSHNPGIKLVPDELGRLKKLYDFPTAGLKLQVDPALLKGTPADLVSFLSSRLRNAVPYRRFKLMIVGGADRGKSSLLRQLAGVRHPARSVATVGIELKDWILKPPKNSCRKSPSFQLTTWDFAGQEDFYSTHQYFLSSRALYLCVYNVSKGREDLEVLRPWLLNIQAGAPGASVILVGTHADLVPKESASSFFPDLMRHIEEFAKSPGFPFIKTSAIVNCMKETKKIIQLRDKIYEVISDFEFRGTKIMHQMVPKSYVELEDLIHSEARRMEVDHVPPIIPRQRLWNLTAQASIHLDYKEFLHASKFLCETGAILHFNDPVFNLSDLYFIDPQWLCQMMARVVTVKAINPYVTPLGELHKKDAINLFHGEHFSQKFVDTYYKLLCKFEVVVPISEERFLVSCKVPVEPPSWIAPLHAKHLHSGRIIVRRYSLPYIPMGFWTRLITRLMLFADAACQHFDKEKEQVKQICYWQTGMYVSWSITRFFMVIPELSKPSVIDLMSSINPEGIELLGHLVDHMDALIEEWYPGINDPSAYLQEHVQRLVPCCSCFNKANAHFFPLQNCVQSSFESDFMECPNCGPVFIRSIAPDVVLGDLGMKMVVNECDVELQNKPAGVLGTGAFASVYKAKVNGKDVAAKVFSGKGDSCANRLLRQEVRILHRLHHPCLVSMVGVCLRPRMLLLELAPFGSLATVLASEKFLSKVLKHRIAMQVAEGLRYIHSQNIVYRDLKPGNILIFSLSVTMPIIAKISDYGISQYATPLGLAGSKGTPGYQAPEVFQPDCIYNTKVDIFSFGATLFEMVNDGRKLFSEIPLHSDLGSAVSNNDFVRPRSKVSAGPWPDVEDVIARCLQTDPEKRPSAAEVCGQLGGVDLLCLRRAVPVCKDQAIECLLVREYRDGDQEEMEIWVASGQNDSKSQLSWISLSNDRKQRCRGKIVREGRVLCIVAIHDKVVVGTNEGHLLMYNATSHDLMFRPHKLTSAVLCLRHVRVNGDDKVIAGLADGRIAVYDVKQLESDTPPTFLDIHQYLPQCENSRDKVSLGGIKCVEHCRERLFCVCGQFVVVLRAENMQFDYRWKAASENESLIQVIIAANHVYTACSNSSCIAVWDMDNQSAPRNVINCAKLIQKYENAELPAENNVVSMHSMDGAALWVGLTTGHVLILDIKRGHLVISVSRRHEGPVRSVESSQRTSGKPSSFILTGGMGFNRKCGVQQASNGDSESDFGYVLVWDADLPKQSKHLKVERNQREQRAAEMAATFRTTSISERCRQNRSNSFQACLASGKFRTNLFPRMEAV